MSTRAIIAIKNDNNTIIGAWCWNDGYDIIENLRADFSSNEAIEFLLKLGMFNTIFTKEAAADYKKWCKEQGIQCDDKEFHEYGNSVVLQDKRNIGREVEKYKDLQEALGQDINVLYLYENGNWTIYDDNTYKYILAENHIETVQKIAADNDWTTAVEDTIISFQTYTTYGQDCNFNIDIGKSIDEFLDNLYNYYIGFDVSAETYQWLDSEGHGTNGAPYDMMDVYNDMKEYEEKILSLWRALKVALEKE